MPSELQNTLLVRFLASVDGTYASKLEELRQEAIGWLAYTTASFGHYTAHTIQHSEEIVRQIGNVLFIDADPKKPVVSLSAVEAYVLCTAALLHDTGMVVSDSDKLTILGSPEWNAWLTADPIARARHDEITALRDASTSDAQHFAADRELRLLVSEFARRTHHKRSATFITAHEPQLGRFAFGDPLLLRTIADVCTAHGVDPYELEDRNIYPEQRDVRGEKINVRFCALLLRIGDLLDLNHDRACPLLLNAASPLPVESIAHWTQYQGIFHRETDPEKIELAAACDTQLEHRYLQDWCQWLVAELNLATKLMAHAPRHGKWSPPRASIGASGSIRIAPSVRASYVPTRWQLELDTEEVFARLINDVTTAPFAFLRELVQNACDASRSRMYMEIMRNGSAPPASPQDASAGIRARYPIRIERYSTQRFSELSQSYEDREVIAVEDVGIGMDKDIVERFFLQVGRSYYKSADFARQFGFVPTSRFGVGFLSVFAHSDDVKVDTLKVDAAHADALSMTLTGPKSYLLTERGRRATPGTRVEVVLRHPSDSDLSLCDVVSEWCKRVEFPVVIDDHGTVAILQAEDPTDFVYDDPDVTQPDGVMGVRAHAIKTPGVDGELYIFYRSTQAGESWADAGWARYTYPTLHPSASEPRVPNDLICVHGIATSEFPSRFTGVSARLDYRRAKESLSLDREHVGRFHGGMGIGDPVVREHLDALTLEHLADTPLARGDNAWRYRQKLLGAMPPSSIWLEMKDTVRAFVDGVETPYSLRELANTPKIEVAIPATVYADAATRAFDGHSDTDDHLRDSGPIPRLLNSHVKACASRARSILFEGRSVTAALRLSDGAWCLIWELGPPRQRIVLENGRRVDVIGVSSSAFAVRANLAFNETYEHAILNSEHPFVQWLLSIQHAAALEGGAFETRWDALARLLGAPIWHGGFRCEEFNRYVERWRESGAEPTPPAGELGRAVFF